MGFARFAIAPALGAFVAFAAGVAQAEDATATSATTPSTAPSLSTTAPAQNDPNAVICRKGEPPIGSRIPGPSVCHTRAQWDAMRQQSREDTMKLQTTSGAGKGTGM